MYVFSMFVGTEREREREVEKLFKFTSWPPPRRQQLNQAAESV